MTYCRILIFIVRIQQHVRQTYMSTQAHKSKKLLAVVARKLFETYCIYTDVLFRKIGIQTFEAKILCTPNIKIAM